jgi:hypothetical protein
MYSLKVCILAPPTLKEVCTVYFTPILDETLVNTPTFFIAMNSDALHKSSGIIWSKASIRGGHRIILPINKEEHLAHLKAKQDIGGKFVAVSWITEFIHKTINYEGIICPLTPLIITPLFLDTNPKQAAALSPTGGTDQPGGSSPMPRDQLCQGIPGQGLGNQILCNVFLITLTACITPVIPDELDPTAAVLYYNSIEFTDTATIITLIKEYERDLPPPT